MPKTELHLHLFGAIPLETMWKLIQKHNGTNQVKSIKELKQKYQFRDFAHFLEIWMWQQQFFLDYEDLELIAADVAEDLVKQNIVYAEVFFTASPQLDNGLSLEGICDSIIRGFAKFDDKIDLSLIHDFGRNRPPKDAMDVLTGLHKLNRPEIIGIGIGGPEKEFPPEPFKELYQQAREWGFKTNAHAGEAAGAESIWGAVKTLEADRIGHATRAFENPKLIDYLLEKQIPLEMNPISNIRTQVIDDIKNHPVKDYFEKGLLVTVNSDDPKMFHTSLENEYITLIKELDFSLKDIQKLEQNSINAAWSSESKKRELNSRLTNYFLNKQDCEGEGQASH